MRRTLKQSILGKQISKAEALKGLGDPRTWKKESEAFYETFRSQRVQTKQRVVKLNTFRFSSRVIKALSSVGIHPSQTKNLSDTELRKVAGIGKEAVKEIRQKLRARTRVKSKRK